MTAKLEHVAIIVKDPLKTAQWFEKYFGFEYYSGDKLVPNMQNTRTIIQNKDNDQLEIFNHGGELGVYNGAIKHLCFVTDSLDEYFAKFKEDNQLSPEAHIIAMEDFKLFFVTTEDNVSIELIQRGVK